MEEDKILKYLGSIRNLPTLPLVLQKLSQEVRKSQTDAERVAAIIEDDPAMMARIMRVVNSVFYAGVEPATSVKHAVARMGFKAVNNIALSTAVFSVMPTNVETVFDRRDFWKHCITTGMATAALYDLARGSLNRRHARDMLHLAGLLHDVGKIVFEQYFHDLFAAAVTTAGESGRSLAETERETIGADHAAVGAWLAARWNLSPEITNVIQWHHDPAGAPDEYAELVLLCHIANCVCNSAGFGNSGDRAAQVAAVDSWRRLGLESSAAEEVIEAVNRDSPHSELLLSFVA